MKEEQKQPAKDTLTLSIVQGNIVSNDVAANLEYYGQKIASGSPADLWVLPETFATGFTFPPAGTTEKDGETILAWLKAQAVRHGTAVCGSAIVADGLRRFNRFYLADASGRVQQYDKRHLFSYGNEGKYISQGDSRELWELHGWKIMPTVCYDLRFPVWSRNDRYYDLMLCAANWPESRIAAWDTLLRARAIENMAYVAAANRIGKDSLGSVHTGHSDILTPLGKSLVGEEKRTNEAILSASISLSRIRTIRDKYGFLEDMDRFFLEK